MMLDQEVLRLEPMIQGLPHRLQNQIPTSINKTLLQLEWVLKPRFLTLVAHHLYLLLSNLNDGASISVEMDPALLL
jgi:hypothetical protein